VKKKNKFTKVFFSGVSFLQPIGNAWKLLF